MDVNGIYGLFPDHVECVMYLEALRWGGKPICPFCNGRYSTPLRQENRHHCNACNGTYSVTARTMFHGTRLPLQKWFLAIALVLTEEKKLSARRLAEKLEIDKNSAASLLKRIRESEASHYANYFGGAMEDYHVPFVQLPDQSSGAFIKALRQLDMDWTPRLPPDAQLVLYIVLLSGERLELGHITEEGFHGLRIQGRDHDGETYVLIAHQATIQIVCKVAKVTPERPRRPIGFGPTPPKPPEATAS